MEINVTLIGQMIAFAIFVWFTMKYVWPPITSAMQERQQKIADGLAAADKGARALKDASAKSEEALKQAREEAREIVAGANKQAGQIVEQARESAKSEGERLKDAARGEIEQELTSAREALRKQVGELAVAGAAQILGREIDASAHGDLLDKLAKEL